jgi:RNA polymerase sigma-B factor
MSSSTSLPPSSEAPPGPTMSVADARAIRNERVLANLHLVERCVHRYSRRGVASDDLRQAGQLALVEAAGRYDPERGDCFEVFASVTIEGSLKRYFRDRSWTVRPPRGLLELHLEVRRANDDLKQRLGRNPTIDEVASDVGVDVDHVHQALEASGAHWGVSLDAPLGGDESAGAWGSWLGCIDAGFTQVEARSDLARALARLGDDDRELLRLRFVENLTQLELSERLGLSQSYVSRMIRSVLVRLRRYVEEVDAPPAAVVATSTSSAGAAALRERTTRT